MSPKPIVPAACVLLATVMLATTPSAATACATCACGDPTLTVMGAQQPFEHRLRVSLELQHRSDAVGDPSVDRVELSEQRATLGVAYAPARWLMLSGSLPVLRRELTLISDARESFVNVGDVELRARAFVYSDRAFAPQHLIALVAGLRMPTGPLQRGEGGSYDEPELQPGSGSWDPLAGVSYAHFADPWSFYASEVVYIPTPSRADWQQGVRWLGSHAAQYQLDERWALRLGANFRLEDRTRRNVDTDAPFDEPDTGGFVLFLMPSVVFSPVTDLVLNLDVNVPVINALVGEHDEGVIFSVGGAFDA
jgi:hypothetical protein